MPPPPERIAIYARYSSDLQNPSSIPDQVALCRALVERELGTSGAAATVFSDAEITGATMRRPGLRALLRAADGRRFDLVVAEGLDRLSRALKDIAMIHHRLKQAGVNVHTAHEGRVSTLHIGLKGTMNELYLDDMKDKVRRGLQARAREGRVAAGRAYGYRVVRGVVDDRNRYVNGLREIDAAEAAAVRRIFAAFVAGTPVKAIARALNDDGIPAPTGGQWRPSTITGTRSRGDGILRKETYHGVSIYNRQRPVVDPVTGRKRRVMNPESEWIVTETPDLRIVDEETWEQARKLLNRRAALVERARPKPAPRAPAPPPSLWIQPLTGLVRCGVCGGNANLANRRRYVCATARFAKTCRNYRAVRSPQLVEALFPVLRDSLAAAPALRPAVLISTAERTRRNDALGTQAARLRARIDRLWAAIEDGVDPIAGARRIRKLEAAIAALERRMAATPAPPPETAIRASIGLALDRMETCFDAHRHAAPRRRALRTVVAAITLTPIEGKKRGSTIDIDLRPDGWPAFWRLLDDASS